VTFRAEYVRGTYNAYLYRFKDGVEKWVPVFQVNSRTKFPASLGEPEIHEVRVSDWWWDKFMEEEEPTE
jgi:hypothetical protein